MQRQEEENEETMISIKGFTNEDDTLVVWTADAPIPDCLGFAIERRSAGGATHTLRNYVGFPTQDGSSRPSTEWPFQRWKWTDHGVSAGDRVAYRVTAMVGTPDHLAAGPASDWTEELVAEAGSPIGAHFNRGIVASQWVARRLGADTVENHPRSLLDAIKHPGDPLREELSGELRKAILELLDAAIASGDEIYAALFELSDPELIGRLVSLGQRAHVVLANGAHAKAPGQPAEDENAAARATLTGVVDLHDRMVHSGLAHNKFLVVVRAGTPVLAWTGSTNWTPGGLCTQANNALVIADTVVAQAYLAQWHRLLDAGDRYPPTLKTENGTAKSFDLGGRRLRVWFTPMTSKADLADATALIEGAEQAILFLMFNPGPVGTLLNVITARIGSNGPSGQPLYVRGVANQDPGGRKQPVFMYDERGIVPQGLEVVLPAAIDDPFARWSKELLKAPSAHAMVHSKVIVLDPLGDHPVVMTGSHNLGRAASGKNDDNLVIVEGDRALAMAYAVNILSAYGNYRWRENHLRAHPGSFANLAIDDSWQSWGLAGDGQAEHRFWFGS
jgi:phosphatidylserine/phosphatidylglycerophosphate/cardiolipin synthase-like enzyme